MIRQVRSLYYRYERAHLQLNGKAGEIRDASGAFVGYVDRVQLHGGVLHVTGWANAASVKLRAAGMQDEVVPGLHRPDVEAATHFPATVGFQISLPCDGKALKETDAPSLIVTPLPGNPEIGPISLRIPHAAMDYWRVRLAFIRDLFRAIPEARRWSRKPDLASRQRLKRVMRLDPLPTSGPLPEGMFRSQPQPAPENAAPVTIILPVYNAFELLQECLHRIDAHRDVPCQLIIIEDASPDERIRPFVHGWAADRDWVEIVENESNLGFIGSVNRGLEMVLAKGGDDGPVVLLNSDALLPPSWASRISQPFQDHPEVATVTPLSNDAEILSAPVIVKRVSLAPHQGDAIDAVVSQLDPDIASAKLPTGVGFCMAMSRQWLRRIGLLDPIFGRGYGEEVDWCLRASEQGAVHVGLANLFVEHRGGESFGQDEKKARIAASGRIITQRYPHFDLAVQRFIGADPLRGARLVAGLSWAASLDPEEAVPIYLAHTMGGGAELSLQDRVNEDLVHGRPSVILRVGGQRRWRLELTTADGVTYGESDDADVIRDLVSCLHKRKIIYSCGVGDRDPVKIPAMLLSLLGPDHEAQLLFHDYLPLSPDYTLIGSDGVYRGPIIAPNNDPAHRTRRPDGTTVQLQEWQAAWHAFARQARIITFSRNSAQLVEAVWPDLKDRIEVRPHRLHQDVATIPPPNSGKLVIGVLGSIGRQKGAGVVQDLSKLLPRGTAGAGLVVLGNLDPTYTLAPPATVHGGYDLHHLPQLAKHYGISHWLIPSIWPETFCYVVHEALATGLPVIAFDIGAQGDAVKAAPNGIVLPYGDGRQLALKIRQHLINKTSNIPQL